MNILGAGEYYVVSGKMVVRSGVENGRITATTGDYGYEPNGVIHDMTNFPERTILDFRNYGPIRYIDDDNNTVGLPGLAERPEGRGGRHSQPLFGSGARARP
jgi:hypothetical protein